MLNGIIDSRKVRAQKAASSPQSSGSSFVPHCSEDRLKIEILKESMRQRDEEMRQQNKKMRRRDEAMRQQESFGGSRDLLLER
jgi:hypothetical protein